MYLTGFTFPNEDREADYLWDSGMISVYPFKLLSKRGLEKLDFSPVTILYGGNGSGKSTALNIIAEKLKIERDSIYSKSRFFLDYVEMCGADAEKNIPKSSKIITSDDVFDYMLNIRNLNEGIEVKREEYNKEYLDAKYSAFRVNSIEDYERLRTMNKTRRLSRKQFVKSELIDSVRELSNGESAFTYFTEKIEENGLYILDEPENSLSPKRQLELQKFIASKRENMPDTKVLYDLADFFKVIGDGTRIQLLWALQQGEMCVGDLSDLLNMTSSAVSHQLKALRTAKLIRSRREGKSIFYALDDNHVEGILDLALEHLHHK